MAPVRRNQQGLNYIGNTWSTHCLIATMMKNISTNETMSKLLSAFAADAEELLHQGIGEGEQKVWLVHLANKGDLPALAKIGRFFRSFSHVPKAATSKKPGRGVCWRCLAGQERDDANNRVALPYEDVTCHPVWEPSIGQELPWTNPPSILKGLGLSDFHSIEFFQTDLFHNLHLGVLKSFTSSALVCIIEASPPLQIFADLGSVDDKFSKLTEVYQKFFEERGRKPYIAQLARETVNWPQSSACPSAHWNKGMATVEVARFLDWFGQQYLVQSSDPVLKSIVLWLPMVPFVYLFLLIFLVLEPGFPPT